MRRALVIGAVLGALPVVVAGFPYLVYAFNRFVFFASIYVTPFGAGGLPVNVN